MQVINFLEEENYETFIKHILKNNMLKYYARSVFL